MTPSRLAPLGLVGVALARKAAGSVTGLPDPVVAIAEDAVVIIGAARALRS